MPIVKISAQSHRFIENERKRLEAERGRRVTQAEIVEQAIEALTEQSESEGLRVPCGGCGSLLRYSHIEGCPSIPTEVIA